MSRQFELINFRVPSQLREKLNAQAFSEGLSRSEILRNALEQYLHAREPVRRDGLEKAIQTTTR
jgi:metal-responsive CopG/Arc/MetJ family transcriptional regulator